MGDLVNRVALLVTQMNDPTATGIVVTGGDPLLKVEQIITLIREQIFLNIIEHFNQKYFDEQIHIWKYFEEVKPIVLGESKQWGM
jgi:pyruvate formate-lyase activating enzyme-like uncharacterized protein